MRKIHAEDLILVAVITDPRDLEIARVLGWYRIPVASAPKSLHVDWIAFYQTAAFGEARWSIRYLASVKGQELVRRIDLLNDEPDHPRAQEPYIKLQLGPMLELPRPIPSERWRRFTFLYTTGERLLAAREMKDLRMTSTAQRDRLWRMLRERGQASQEEVS